MSIHLLENWADTSMKETIFGRRPGSLTETAARLSNRQCAIEMNRRPHVSYITAPTGVVNSATTTTTATVQHRRERGERQHSLSDVLFGSPLNYVRSNRRWATGRDKRTTVLSIAAHTGTAFNTMFQATTKVRNRSVHRKRRRSLSDVPFGSSLNSAEIQQQTIKASNVSPSRKSGALPRRGET